MRDLTRLKSITNDPGTSGALFKSERNASSSATAPASSIFNFISLRLQSHPMLAIFLILLFAVGIVAAYWVGRNPDQAVASLQDLLNRWKR